MLVHHGLGLLIGAKAITPAGQRPGNKGMHSSEGGKYARGCRIRKTGESQPCASYIHKAGVTAYLQSRSKVNAWDWWWTRPGNISETRAREPDADP
jgi:hypothetical protein